MSVPVVTPAAPGQRFKFIVKSAEEAAAVIRERLGEHAQVISVRQVEGEGLARFVRAPKLEIIAEVSAPAPQSRVAPATSPEEPASASQMPPAASDGIVSKRIWTMLERAGLPREFVARIEHRPDWQVLPSLPLHAALARAALLLRAMATGRDVPLAKRTAFFGSPGGGSTTALCKHLSAEVFLRDQAACVIKLDASEPNSTEALAVFCEALGVPLLRSEAEIVEISDDVAVYFDIPGAVHAGRDERERVARAMDNLGIQSRVLVVNAAYERELIQQAYDRAASLGGTHVVFTHLDELTRCGKLWEFVLGGRLTPLFGSNGPDIAGDCERDIVDLLVRRTLAAGSL